MLWIIYEHSKPEFQIKSACCFVNRMNFDSTDTKLPGKMLRAAQGIDQQQSAKSLTMGAPINSQATNQNRGNIDRRQALRLIDR